MAVLLSMLLMFAVLYTLVSHVVRPTMTESAARSFKDHVPGRTFASRRRGART